MINQDKLEVVISSPSLKEEDNVSGVSSVVRNIFKISSVEFVHFIVGSKDSESWILGKIYRNISAMIKLISLLKQRDKVVFHSNTALNADSIVRDYVFCLIANFLRTPTLLHLHGGKYMTEKLQNTILKVLLLRLFGIAKVILVLSEIEKSRIAAWYGIDSGKITVLSNCVDYEGDDGGVKKEVNKSKVDLLYFGRIHESKGVKEIVNAVEGLSDRSGIRLSVCGDGPLKVWFCHEMKRLLGDDFIYKGIVKGDDKWNAFAEMDYFLLPSKYGEGLPMALLETMSAGVVPITTDGSSVANLVNETNGIIVKTGDSLSLQQALESLISNRSEQYSKSICCKKLIEDSFSCSGMRNDLVVIYDKISK